MRIAVIDDEKYSRIELIHQIKTHLPDAEIVEAASGAQAMQLLEKSQFDILFIDVRLGDMQGTTVAALARRLMPAAKIIFATAYSEYAVTAFELEADNYLLKPFAPDRIEQVLIQCTKNSNTRDTLVSSPRIAIGNSRHTRLLDISSIVYIETDGSGKGCFIYTTQGEQIGDNSPLSVLEPKLQPHGFFRIHKTCLVQLNYIQDIFPWNSNSFALRVQGYDTTLPVGRERMKQLKSLLHI